MSERRFPRPWSAEETDAWFIAKDRAGGRFAAGANLRGATVSPSAVAILVGNAPEGAAG